MNSNERKHKIFVYGTLKRNFGNWSWCLKNRSNYLGKYKTKANYTMLHLGGFPGVVEKGKTPIHGEVFEVDNEVFKDLDRLEGYPTLYDRKEIDTEYGKAWIYLLANNRDNYYSIIDDGIWR